MFNFDKLIEDAKQELEVLHSKSSKLSSNIGVLFLKDGTHKFRIIPVDDKLIVTEDVHSYEVNEEIKNVVCLGEECPICKVANEVEDWKIKAKKMNKSFVYLISTDSQHKYYTPESYYILISNGDRFKKALLTYITSTYNEGENGKVLVSNLLDYTKETQGSLQVMFQSGNQGFINVSFDPLTKSPKLNEEIIKNFNLMKAFIDFTVKPDLKELEEDAIKLRLKYNKKEKIFTEQAEIATQSIQQFVTQESVITETVTQEPTQQQQQQTTQEPIQQQQQQQQTTDVPECFGNVNPRDIKCLQCIVIAKCLQETANKNNLGG